MKNNEIMLINLLLCGLLGLIGQGVRVIVGLKKLREEASAQATDAKLEEAILPPDAKPGAVSPPADAKAVYDTQFDARKLWMSLFIGFIAGCLAGLSQGGTTIDVSSSGVAFALLAAGYAGADFIEGIFKKVLPGS